jgi:hypothetical protein
MDELRQLTKKLRPFELRVERVFRPRMPQLSGDRAARVIGIVCFLLSLIVVVPVPMVHMMPAAAIALFGLALLYRDGVLVVLAVIAGLLSIAVSAILIGSGWYVLGQIMAHFRG